MPRTLEVELNGKTYPFEVPDGAGAAQIKTLAARALKAAGHKEFNEPALARGVLGAPKPQGEIKATPWNLRDALSNKITDALSGLGMEPGHARRLAEKTTSALSDLSPVGVAVSADDARQDFAHGNYWSGAGNAVMAALGAIPGAGAGEKVAAHKAEEVIGDAIRAWHGSPHKFDKFDASRLLTGEGTLAEGPGLYFSQDRNYASLYKDIPYPGFTPPGHLYEVNINAPLAKVLPLEKKLRDIPQGDELRRGALDMFRFESPVPDDFSGFNFVNMVRGGFDDADPLVRAQKARQALLDLGVPAASYPYPSPSPDKRNFVVFNPSLVDIVGRY